MSDFTGPAIAGRVATPSDPDWDEARLAWNLAADQQPEAVAFVESADDVAATIRFAAENGLKVAGQGTGHGAFAACRLARGHDPDQDRAHARNRGRPRRPDRAGRGRRPRRRAEQRRPEARPQLDARLLARRRRHRLHPRRRPQLARPPLRLCLQPRAGDRARQRRRRAAHRRRRERARAVLGAARRRWRLRDRHRPAAAPAAGRRDLRRRPRLPRRARCRGRPRLPRLGRRRLRRRHLGGPLHHPAADPRRARADPRPAAADDRRRLHCQQGGGRRDRRAAARARRDDHGHLGPRSRPPASAASTWTRRTRCPASARG